jgi:hypothetical protein
MTIGDADEAIGSAPISAEKHRCAAEVAARQLLVLAAQLVAFGHEGLRLQAEEDPCARERLTALFERAVAAGASSLADLDSGA